MKKLIMLATILALALAAAIPALAQQTMEQGIEPESGNTALNHTVVNKGNYASQCTPALQTGNTGNFDNSPAVLQYNSKSGGIEPEGIEASFGGPVTADCPSTVEQSSAASG